MITNTQSGTNIQEVADGIYQNQHAREHSGRRAVQLQPVPHPG